MNVELLKKVATKLRRMRHKKHFNMRTWARKTECGTTACIAGHALIDAGYKVKSEKGPGWKPAKFFAPDGREVEPEAAGRKLLGLTARQAARLFDDTEWPDQFKYDGSFDLGFKAIYNDPKVAAARIDHFIKTNGKE